MLKVIRDNSLYFFLFGIFLLVTGIFLMNIHQGDAIRYFSEIRHHPTDVLMTYITKLGEEPLYFFFGICCLFLCFRYSIMIVLVGIIVTVVSHATKSFFAYDRPYTYFEKLNLLDTINLLDGVTMHKGATSFPSGHTMSAFALYTLIMLLIRKDKNNWAPVLILTAIMVGISRIYMVQHFLQDIFLGAIFGVFISLVLYVLHLQVAIDPDRNWYDKKVKI